MQVDDPTHFEYVLVQWPETQELMDELWFDEHASLADFNKFGNSAYFIPKTLYYQFLNKHFKPFKS